MKLSRSIRCIAIGTITLIAGAGNARGEVTFEIIGGCLATDVSADGSVIAGNTQDYGTFRWTEETGIVDLGRNAWIAIGQAAGTPDVSADGTRISASIVDSTGAYLTPGLWEQGVGWTDLMPPMPPDGGIMDNAYGSAWGLSGDGLTVTGLYWRPGQPGGSANAFHWTSETGVVSLGSGGGNSRANGANGDGSVIAGWDENPVTGPWRPAAWVNGVKTILGESADTDGFAEATAVNTDGTLIVGSSWDDGLRVAVATVWRWNGTTWDEDPIGTLPGTPPDIGNVVAQDLSDDGSIIVGFNQFSFGNFAGFLWTQETGMVNVVDFLADHGITVDPTLIIQSLTGITDDGSTIVGLGQDTFFPWGYRSFVIRLTPPPCPWDCGDGDGTVGVVDFLALLAQWGQVGTSCDVDGGGVGVTDFLELLATWGSCP
ncbi:MAG: hypothetical protein ACYS15_07115 [Planctomycetota bacterium]|jgi:uncharacterized membrane protein